MTEISMRGSEPVPVSSTGWIRAPGLELLGPTQGSGLREPAYLVRRADDQMAQVSELLHLVLVYVDRDRTLPEVAAAVSLAYGRTLTVEGLEHLITTRLEPLGLVEHVDAESSADPPRANPLLALTVKGTLIPAALTRRLARVLEPTYWPPVVVAVVVAAVVLDLVVATRADFWSAVTELFTSPTLVLAMYALLTFAAVIHELGHATACRYGGAEPGEIGFGIYIVFPAFYTDVTDSYRLTRGGRVRTDLGGLYFNLLCVIALAVTYLLTGSGLVLLTALVLHMQMLQQLIPVVRFDGYYVLSDLAGVPDLFARVGPVLRSLRPGEPRDPRVEELRPRSRRLVVGWVLVVVPLLTFVVVWMLWHLPEFVDHAAAGIELQQWSFDAAWDQRDLASMALATLSVALILLPLVGVSVVLWRLSVTLGRFLAARLRGHPKHKETQMSTRTEPGQGLDPFADLSLERPPSALSAADFTDARMLPPQAAAPTLGWRRAVHRASGRTINPGPGPAEVRRAELETRLRAPFEAARHVVVMSRKGGVGKTTMTMALGSTFALARGDRVIAVDANPDAGNLAHRVAVPNDRNITDVLQDLDSIETYAQLKSYTSQAEESRLEVLGSDDDPRIGMALDRTDYHRLIGLLDRFYNLILLDTGTGILDSANQGLLTEADQVVLVLRPGVDAGRAAALTLDWMDEHGFEDLVARAVVVINGMRRDGEVVTDRMRRHFEKRCERVVAVPWDGALEAGARTDLSNLRRATRDSFMEVAASVADNFSETGERR
jgi:putative peptide zinc metalloprotease protein